MSSPEWTKSMGSVGLSICPSCEPHDSSCLLISSSICLSSFASAIMFVIFDLIVSRRMKSGLLKNNEVTEETKSAVHDDDIKEIDMKVMQMRSIIIVT